MPIYLELIIVRNLKGLERKEGGVVVRGTKKEKLLTERGCPDPSPSLGAPPGEVRKGSRSHVSQAQLCYPSLPGPLGDGPPSPWLPPGDPPKLEPPDELRPGRQGTGRSLQPPRGHGSKRFDKRLAWGYSADSFVMAPKIKPFEGQNAV